MVQIKAGERTFNGGEGKKMDGSGEVLVIICLAQKRGKRGIHFNSTYVRFKLNGEGRYFKTKLTFYPYYNNIRVLRLKSANQIIHWYQFSDLGDTSNIIKYL